MKISLTKKEYKALLDLLYISDWVLHAHQETMREETNEYKELEQKLMAMAGEFGMEQMVERSAATGAYFPSRQFVAGTPALRYMEEFENATFWEELLERLARRDFIAAHGEEAILKMSVEERFEKETDIQKGYDKEFCENGLVNVYIRKMNKPEM